MPKESVMADAEVRETVRSWLTEHWDINRPLDEWRECLVDGGWAAPAWPVEFFGRGYSVEQAVQGLRFAALQVACLFEFLPKVI